MARFSLEDETLDVAALRATLLAGDAGAYCSYEGWVRNRNLDRPVVVAYLTALARDSRVEYVEPNYLVQSQLIPNDTRFIDLWGLNNEGQTGGTVDADIDAVEAWNLSTGSTGIPIMRWKVLPATPGIQVRTAQMMISSE